MGVLLLVCGVCVSCASSCASDHQVSPWGAAGRPTLGAFIAPPDLDARLHAIDVEAAELGLTLEVELRGALRRGGEVVVRGYSGTDALGRRTSAVRVATPHGVVLAAGPLDARRVDRSQATQLIPSLLPGSEPEAMEQLGVFRSGTDLNRDGAPDVVLRSENGELEIWAVQPLGATRYAVELAAPPRFALDVDRDGTLELAGRIPLDEGDPIAPDLLDVAGFEEIATRTAAASLGRSMQRAPKAPARRRPARASGRSRRRTTPRACGERSSGPGTRCSRAGRRPRRSRRSTESR